MSGPILGIDIGGTKLAVGVATPDGRLLSDMRRPSDAADGPDAMIERVLDMSRAAVNDAGLTLDEVDAIGIGCGGPLDPWSGVILNALNNPGWVNVPLVARIEEGLGCPAHLDNDANAAALGEHRFGAGRGVAHMVYLTISTGVGGGVVIEGGLFRGAGGNGGELGHVTVDYDGRPCRGCGRRGCLEAYVSGTSIAERAGEAGMGDVTAADVVAGARAGERLAGEVWAGTIEALACGITSIVNLFEPEVVVLGGGVVSGSGEQLLGPVRERVAADAFPPAARAARIVESVLGKHVGVVGAAVVAVERTASSDALAHG